jgi:hypothetical protein
MKFVIDVAAGAANVRFWKTIPLLALTVNGDKTAGLFGSADVIVTDEEKLTLFIDKPE